MQGKNAENNNFLLQIMQNRCRELRKEIKISSIYDSGMK